LFLKKILKIFRRESAFNRPSKELVKHGGILFEWENKQDGTSTLRLADVDQTINGVRQLKLSNIEEMVVQKNNLEYQHNLCLAMMKEGDILPFCFERAAILLRKEKRYKDELNICLYIKDWCDKAEKSWSGTGAKHWLSPKFQKCIQRIPKLFELIEENF